MKKDSSEAAASSSAKEAPSTPSKRTRPGRKGEQEEDNELLRDAEAEDNVVHAVRIAESPSWIVGGQMRGYQIDGLNWMIQLYENGVNGILADEMGLGKTLETISLLGYMKNVLNLSGPHLVIVPNSTLANWKKEFTRWCPSLKAVVFHGDKEKRAALKLDALFPGDFDVAITTYEMILRELTALGKFHWRYIVIDEAHRIKNEESKLSEAVRVLKSNNRLLLTGTPLQNNLHELWALLNFLMPDLFESSVAFDEWFKAVQTGDGKGSRQQDTVAQLHKILKPFLLRRVKADVETALLPKKEVKIFVGLSSSQRELYRKVLLKDLEAVNGAVGGNSGKTRLLNIAMQLRKVCNHPYLFQGVEPGPPFVEGEHLVTVSGKLMVLDKLLRKLKSNGNRVLIFSQMTRMLDILEDFLEFRGYKFCRIDGSTAQEEREVQIEAYNDAKSTKFAFLLSTRAGGLGINLATADTVILFDSDWNPQMDLQAMDRAHRIGQKKQVMVYRLVVQDTIEQKIVERAEAKLYLDALVIQQGRLVEKHQNASGEELLRMVKFGADTIFQAGNDSEYQITDADINDIIALGQKKTEEFSDKLKAANLSLASFSLDQAMSNLYEHDGQDYSALHKDQKKNLLMTWIAPPKRETKVSTYSESAYYNKALNPNAKERKRTVVPTRHPKQPAVLPHMFVPAKLQKLFDIETKRYLAEYAIRNLEEKLAANPEDAQVQKEIEKAKDSLPPALTASQEAERDRLVSEGFFEWKRQEFQAFMRGLDLYGRDAIAEIAAEVGFSEEEVKRYHTVFWKEYKSLPEWEKLIQRVERGEQRREKQKHLISLLKDTFSQYKEPLVEVDANELFGLSLSKDWTQETDLWLLVTTNQVGYGNWERLKRKISETPRFALDWFMQSRSSEDLHERVDRLLKNLLEKSKRRAAASQPAEVAVTKQPTQRADPAKRKKKAEEAAAAPTKASKSKKRNVVEAENDGEKKQKKKKEGPKKARSGYIFFQMERRSQIVADKPGLSFGEVAKIMSAEWSSMSAEDKKKFESLALADQKRYKDELEVWEKEHPEEAAARKSSKKRAKKDDTNNNPEDMPKHPLSAYMAYTQIARAELKEKNPGISFGEAASVISAQWKTLSDDEKRPYVVKAEQELKDYHDAVAQWRKNYPELAKQHDEEAKQKKEANAAKRKSKASAAGESTPSPAKKGGALSKWLEEGKTKGKGKQSSASPAKAEPEKKKGSKREPKTEPKRKEEVSKKSKK